MPWSSLISTNDVVAIHAALLPGHPDWKTDTEGDGQILLMGGDNHVKKNTPPFSTSPKTFDHAARFNCRHPTLPLKTVNCPAWDVFCCGHAFRGDGNLVIAGGTSTFNEVVTGPHHFHFTAHNHSAVFDRTASVFNSLPDMNHEPGNPGHGGGRWYPTLITLGNGEVYAFGGHPMVDDERHSNLSPEILSQDISPTWRQLGDVGVDPGYPIVYPRMHLLNDGKVFICSKIPDYHDKSIKLNPLDSSVEEVVDLPPEEGYKTFDDPSVMLPLLASDGYTARILLCGESRSRLLDFTRLNLGWQDVPRDTPVVRTHSNATLLPTGQVLLTGGSAGREGPNNQISTGNRPEIYDPPIDRMTRTYIPSGIGEWESIRDSAGISQAATLLRNYHSTALLMPDGRVWTAGGNGPEQPIGDPIPAIQQQIEIFDPPYAPGERPEIISMPSEIGYDQFCPINLRRFASDINIVSLMRCGSSTHAFNSDQRCVWPEFTTSADQVVFRVPPNGNIAPPGWWMVFVIRTGGQVCDYARFVLLR